MTEIDLEKIHKEENYDKCKTTRILIGIFVCIVCLSVALICIPHSIYNAINPALINEIKEFKV